ncbi:hypothetical protein BD311DRAFT_170702 [Dichomitus squalens]|uniref:Uncharacterized protein n=1 Tax=Dichomitus squalens TaxID=114155 RepID=A0A4Q9M4X0_9APHY|nr:hypothetical protein BD311DRAFT_170702 [Dichomitus squalens]
MRDISGPVAMGVLFRPSSLLGSSPPTALLMHLSVLTLVLTIKERSWWIATPVLPKVSSLDDSTIPQSSYTGLDIA